MYVLQKPAFKTGVLHTSVLKVCVAFPVLIVHTHRDVKPFCGLLNRLSPSWNMSDDVTALLNPDEGSGDTLPLSASAADVPRLNKQNALRP